MHNYMRPDGPYAHSDIDGGIDSGPLKFEL
jgi:hypothetical protein